MKQPEMPISHSVVSALALRDQVQREYDLDPVVDCRYWQGGLNDTYMVMSQGQRYVLRLYRANRRSESDIEYELDALTQLELSGVPVSTPIRRRDGQRQASLELPEGKRSYVLFTIAPGTTYSYGDDIQIAHAYGRAVAGIHNATDNFHSPHHRAQLDFNFLVHRPLQQIAPSLQHRSDDWNYLCDLAARIEQALTRLSSAGLDIGFCHGDTNGYNAHLAPGRQLTFFDFDFCGVGWRAYDLASFRWLALMNPNEDRWTHFIKGYTEIRTPGMADLEAVPFLIGARQLWIDGLQIENGGDWGFNGIDDSYFDRKLKYLRDLESNYFPK